MIDATIIVVSLAALVSLSVNVFQMLFTHKKEVQGAVNERIIWVTLTFILVMVTAIITYNLGLYTAPPTEKLVVVQTNNTIYDRNCTIDQPPININYTYVPPQINVTVPSNLICPLIPTPTTTLPPQPKELSIGITGDITPQSVLYVSVTDNNQPVQDGRVLAEFGVGAVDDDIVSGIAVLPLPENIRCPLKITASVSGYKITTQTFKNCVDTPTTTSTTTTTLPPTL